jgi:hypothetical protein
MTLLKRVVGWISWLAVATTGYLVIALGLDSDLRPALPEPVYEWLDSTFEPGSPEASYDLEIWTTGGVVVLAMHVVALVLISTLSRLGSKGWAWKARWRRFSKVVGWTCWFLVATEIIVGIADEVVRAFAIDVPDVRHLPLPAFLGSSVVCALIHGAVFRFIRTRAEVARKCPG